MNTFQFEDSDSLAAERFESASFEEIALSQPNLLAQMRDDADGLCHRTAILRSGVRRVVAQAMRHVSPELRVLSPDDCALMVSQLAALELAAHNVNAVARALWHAAEEVAMPEAPEVAETEAPTRRVLAEGCDNLRRQFFGAAKRLGFNTRPEARDARLLALSGFFGREITSTYDLSADEWNRAVYAVEEAKIAW